MTNPLGVANWRTTNFDNPFFAVHYVDYKSKAFLSSELPRPEQIQALKENRLHFVDYALLFPNLPQELPPLLFWNRMEQNVIKCRQLFPDLAYKMHEKDIVTLVAYRTNQTFVNAVIQGLRREKKDLVRSSQEVEDLILRGDYSSLLTRVWSDKDNRLNWLRQNETRLPPIFLYERAVAEFTHSPTMQTIEEIVFPLFNAASARVSLDGHFLKHDQTDKKVDESDFANRVELLLNGVYIESLRRAAKRYLNPRASDADLSSRINVGELAKATPKTLEEIDKIAVMAMKPDAKPSPHWLVYHTGKFIQAQVENVDSKIVMDTLLLPEAHWASKQQEIAEGLRQNVRLAKENVTFKLLAEQCARTLPV